MATEALASPEEVSAWPERAGFWRRALAFMIDYFVVLIPLYLIVAALFLATDGGVKGEFSLRWQVCYQVTPNGASTSLSRYDWQACKISVMGLEVASWVVGSLSDRETGEIKESPAPAALNLPLNSKGNVRPTPLDLSFLELTVLFCYLLFVEKKFGQSIGKNFLSMKVHDEENFDRIGLPLDRALLRQFIKFLGLWPLTLLSVWYAFKQWGVDPRVVQDTTQLEILLAYLALGLWFFWPLIVGGSIAFSREPLHDRLARTSVRTF